MQTTYLHLIYWGFINLRILFIGYLLIKRKMLMVSWVLLIVSILIIQFIFNRESPVIRMLAITATTFMSMKVVTVAASYKNKRLALNFKQWALFAAGWAGMRPQPFETLGDKAVPNAWPLIWFGVSRVIAGGLLIGLAHFLTKLTLKKNLTYVLVSAILLIGFSLILHFGLLNISAGIWRLQGVNAYSLFKEPVKATSLTELWAKRWNIAFSEMTSLTVFRPVKLKVGNSAALMFSFMFSGLLHELALSVPVNRGYGLPLLYFIIQGLLVLTEKLLVEHGIKVLHHPVTGRVWTLFWLIAPMPLLFHNHFVKEILWPLAGLS